MNRADRHAKLRHSRHHLQQALSEVIVLTSQKDILGGTTTESGYVKNAERETEIQKRIADARLWLDQFEAAVHA